MAEQIEWDVWIHESNVLNVNHSYSHWSKKQERIRACKGMGIVKSMSLERYNHARMDVVVSYPKLYKADVANYYPTMKAYVDGLINIPDVPRGMKKLPAKGILEDDSDVFFDGPFLTPSGERSGKPGWFKFHVTLTTE
jgi:hypothetical protein